MVTNLAQELHQCADLQSVLNCVLDRSLQLCATNFGNIQLMDWNTGYLEIRAQCGFQAEFLNYFERLSIGGVPSTACVRAIRNRDAVAIEDVSTDPQFASCYEMVRRAGVRAVISVPLLSSSGALIGILSTHFRALHRPTEFQMIGLKELGVHAGNAIIRKRAETRRDTIVRSLRLINETREVMLRADNLLVSASGRDRAGLMENHKATVSEP